MLHFIASILANSFELNLFHNPDEGEQKSGKPASVDIPAPVKTTGYWDSLKQHSEFMNFRLIHKPFTFLIYSLTERSMLIS